MIKIDIGRVHRGKTFYVVTNKIFSNYDQTQYQKSMERNRNYTKSYRMTKSPTNEGLIMFMFIMFDEAKPNTKIKIPNVFINNETRSQRSVFTEYHA